MKRPHKLSLALLPTPIHKLEISSARLNREIYIKRDDATGMLISGNKIRKLEYVLKEAIDRKADAVVTCGGLQSNHVRATVISAGQQGFKTFAVLRGKKPEIFDGNTLLTALSGAEITYITEEEYENIETVYDEMDVKLRERGYNPFFIPEGASNSLGCWGYISMMEELNEQQKKLNLEFDSMFVALGSGGTQAGILLGKYMTGNRVDVYGINVFKKTRNLYDYIKKTCEEAIEIYDLPISFDENDITIISDYIGEGYAKTTDAEMQVILETARSEAIYLDPVYTGKAFYGMVDLLKKYPDRFGKRILFVHTGGFFALFPERERISKLILNS